MVKRYNRDRGISEAQSDALYRREHTYSEASGVSFKVAWDWHSRDPKDLREAVRMARQAYADEVPEKLHDHATGEGGTPRLSAKVEQYIDRPFATDEPDRDAALAFYLTPFRAALANLERVNPRRGAIVRHITLGRANPAEAAMREGVPAWCAKLVAEDTLRSFLRHLSDAKVSLAKREAEAA